MYRLSLCVCNVPVCNVCNNNRVKRLEFPLAGLIKYTLLLISTGFKLGIRLFGLVPNFVILYFFLSIQIKEEFRRITTVSLEQSFMYKLDHYTTKLIALMMAKGGVIGTKLRPFMDRLSQKNAHTKNACRYICRTTSACNAHSIDTLSICSQNQSIEMRRETVIRSLILYLGEKEEELFEDCPVKHDFLFVS